MKTVKENAVIKCDNLEQLKECRQKLIRFGFNDDERWNKGRLINKVHKEFPDMNFILLKESDNNVQIHTHECIKVERVYLQYSDLDSYLEKVYGTNFDNPTEGQKELIRYWIDKYYEKSKDYRTLSIHYADFTQKHLLPKPKIEVGKWYKAFEDSDILFMCTQIIGDECFGYGFGYRNIWNNYGTLFARETDKLIEATEQEVTERLIEEAKRRGYHKTVDNFDSFEFIANSLRMKYGGTQHCIYSVCILDSTGKWTEIIDKKAEVKEKIQKLKKEIDELEKLI